MAQPTEPQEEGLLSRLKQIDDSALEDRVEKEEGINGATLKPIYSQREMVIFSVTESELKQINLANIGITAFTSLGSAALAFWLDIYKDTVLAESVPIEAQAAISYVQPVLLFAGVGFWGFALWAIWWRRDMIKTIKKESSNS